MTPNPPSGLETAIHTLYRVFGRYPYKLTEDDKDPCFPNACDDSGFKDVPLGQITAEGIYPFIWKSMTTWGGVDDFKHFLPRILELLADYYGCLPSDKLRCYTGEGPDLDQVCTKIVYAKWRDWPSKEQDVLEVYLVQFWRSLLLSGSMTPIGWSDPIGYFGDALNPLQALTLTGCDISIFLDIWRKLLHDPDTRKPALATLVAMIDQNANGWHTLPTLDNPWADKRLNEHNNKQLKAWLTGPWLLNKMERWYFEYEHEPFAAALSRSLSFLENLQKTSRERSS